MRRLEVLNNTQAQNTQYPVPSSSSLVNVPGLDGSVQGRFLAKPRRLATPLVLVRRADVVC
jgi:hypothetical protein